MKTLRLFGSIVLTAALACLFPGCRSYWVDAEIQNWTGQTIHELEVTYPTASFGVNSLASGATLHYRFQIRGNGPVKVEYTFQNGTATHAEGLNLAEHQQGRLFIHLFPQGRVEFVPRLQPAG